MKKIKFLLKGWSLGECAALVCVFFPFLALISGWLGWSGVMMFLLNVWCVVFISAVVIGACRGTYEIVADFLRKRKKP